MLVAIPTLVKKYPKLKRAIKTWPYAALSPFYKLILNPLNRAKNADQANRQLEIGPGPSRIPGFESLNIVGGRSVDYVYDATRKMPFKDNSFSLIYASHVVEHIPWYRTQDCLTEWARIIDTGGSLEVWVPDGLKIAKAFIEAELNGSEEYLKDNWDRFNSNNDPCLWANGRFFSYGDGTGAKLDPNWHMAIFSERHLTNLLKNAGFKKVTRLSREEVRGYDHGWINLGLRATK